MPIQSGDIQLRASQVMDDVPEGGGAPTATVIPDGASNAIFPDISEAARAGGRVNIRKVFAAVDTPTTDAFFDANVIVAEPPKDPRVSVTLFTTGDTFDRRDAARSRIESYLAAGSTSAWYLFGNHLAGQMTVSLLGREETELPAIGATLVLRKLEGAAGQAEQYVRITRLTSRLRTFEDDKGEYKRMELTLSISDSLRVDFPGFEASRNGPGVTQLNAGTRVRETVVADAARYYGVVPLSEPATIGQFTVQAQSMFTQLVPSAQVETPATDVRANLGLVSLQPAADGALSFTTSQTLSPTASLFIGAAVLPGSLQISVSGGTLTDGNGRLYSGSTEVGTVDYANGVVSIATGGSTYSGAKTVSYKPAAAPVITTDSVAIPVTAESRSLTLALTLDPVPAPQTLTLAYMAQGRWYTLREQGTGALRGSDSSHGVGQFNFVTGGLVATLGALPDVGSSILMHWGSPLTAMPVAGGESRVYFDVSLGSPVAPGSLVLSWGEGDEARMVADDGKGSLTGDAQGSINYATGALRISPHVVPPSNVTLSAAFSDGVSSVPATVATFADLGSAWEAELGSAVAPGTFSAEVMMAVTVSIFGKEGEPTRWRVADDGLGGIELIARLASGAEHRTPIGSIDYATGVVTLDKIFSADVSVSQYLGRWSGISTYYAWEEFTGRYPCRIVSASPALTNVRALSGLGSSAPAWSGPFGKLRLPVRLPGGARLVSGSLQVELGGRLHFDRLGRAVHSIDRGNGSAIDCGAVDYLAGVVTLDQWPDNVPATGTVRAALAQLGDMLVAQTAFRAPVSPIRPGSFSLAATRQRDSAVITATADADGNIITPAAVGKIDYQSGVARIWFRKPAGAIQEGDATLDLTSIGIPGVTTIVPDAVYGETLRFSLVAYTYLPLDATLLGIDPVRLPSDGRVPIFRPGGFAVVGHTGKIGPVTVQPGQVLNAGRVRLSRVRIVGSDGLVIHGGYTADLEAGLVAIEDVTGWAQPITLEHRIEDMLLVRDAQISGLLSFTRALTHDYPAGAYVSSALMIGDMRARCSLLFDQATWNNAWADAPSGNVAPATYNDVLSPVEVTNAGAITERWAAVFTSTTAYYVVGEHVGVIAYGSINADCAPANPEADGAPYFTLRALGWGQGWAQGNALRFNTVGAMAPINVVRTIQQGPETVDDDSWALLIRGDKDRI